MIFSKKIVEEIANSYGTPLYIYSFEEILKRINLVTDVFSGVNFLPTFACKANNNPRIIEVFGKQGFGTDIVSIGEYYASKMAGIDDGKIVWNGNGKSKKDMEYLGQKVKYINIDSLEEYERWTNIQTNAEFFLRVNPDVDPKTHPHISTGLKKNKFGVHLELLEKTLKDKRLKISGFHVHIGSQITHVGAFEEAISKVVELSKRYGFSKINIGGGWGINYKDDELNIDSYKEKVIPYLKSFDLVILELGRYLIAPAGILVLKVEYIKRTPYKTFIVVDGGLNVLIRPAMYNAYHRICVLEPYNDNPEEEIVDLVGPLCESGDILALERKLKIPKEGSFLVIEDVGAYGYAMSNNYNSMPRPAEILVTQTYNSFEAKLIRRRETLNDLFRNVI
ncbi:MAG: diaminopimelate decarboxylase [Fervidobacterium sp.]|nr:diaminopimelate decarboxylase [Fervidobacterium sp.]